MAKIDARKEAFERVELFGRPALFANGRRKRLGNLMFPSLFLAKNRALLNTFPTP